MVFSSITFLFYFLPIVIAIYYIVPNKLKNIILLIFSLLFYFYGEPKYVFLMILSVIITYIFGIIIEKFPKYKKVNMVMFLIISLGFLIYFKYMNFLIQNINLWLKNKIDFINVLLPIGISFYTFQMISYVVDVYRKQAKVQKNIMKLALYISLFPQLIAGPIVRYTTIEEELENRKCTFEKFAIGVRRFIIGLGKKVLIANSLGELNEIFLASNDNSVLFYWMYGISVMLQIYFDFSGYSDMAIGLGKMFGFDFLENFNYPYIAKSITDFWRRWHISLSSWFRDYVYIPLGGNRCNKIKWLRNILIVWFLTGMWHGAAWNFILWGIYFGIILIIEKLIKVKFDKIKQRKTVRILHRILSRIYVLTIVMISFIIFNTEGIQEIKNILCGLLGFGNYVLVSNESLYYLSSYLGIFIVAFISATPVFSMLCRKYFFYTKENSQKKELVFSRILNLLEPVYLLFIFVISVSYIIDGSFNPFLYFRF
ncbi:MAG: MBOAT family protein [Clostridiales bacterium]|nr:MBOAT family protein [Clostridiales bacterium]